MPELLLTTLLTTTHGTHGPDCYCQLDGARVCESTHEMECPADDSCPIEPLHWAPNPGLWARDAVSRLGHREHPPEVWICPGSGSLHELGHGLGFGHARRLGHVMSRRRRDLGPSDAGLRPVAPPTPVSQTR